MLTVLVVLAVAGILFGAAAVATHDGEVLRDPVPDDRGAALPPTDVQPEDVAELRFDMAVRGYRMAQVDAALARLADELARRDQRIGELEQAVVEQPSTVPAEQPVATVEAFEPLEPPAAAPAAISGPLTATTWFTEPAPAPAPEPEPEPEPAPAPEAQPQAEAQPEPEAQAQPEAAPPAAEAERPAPLTLTAADDAFSFPELLPAEPDPLSQAPAPAAPPAEPTGEDEPTA